MALEECHAVTHICFQISDDPMASFEDVLLLNNNVCHDITSVKICEPSKRHMQARLYIIFIVSFVDVSYYSMMIMLATDVQESRYANQRDTYNHALL